MSNFDNQIKQKGENFSLQPRPQVWKRVEAELNKQNRGRIIGWWWLTPVVIIAWGFAFYFLDRKDKKAFYDQDSAHHPLSVIQKPAPSKKPAETVGIRETPPSQHQDETAVSGRISKVNAANANGGAENVQAAATAAAGNSRQKNVSPKHVFASGTTAGMHRPGLATQKAAVTSDNKNIPASAENAGKKVDPLIPVKGSEEKIDSHTIENLSLQGEKSNTSAQVNKPAGTSPQVQPFMDQKAESHSNEVKTVAIGKPANEKIKPKKSSWRFTLDGGIANNEEYIFKKHPKDTLDPNSGGSTGSVPEMEKNRYSYTVGASVERVQWLGKRWQWQAGLLAQYQQMKQRTGVLQPYQVDPSPPDWIYSSFFYFDPGKEYTHKGENYRLSITNDIAFSVFRNKPSLFVKAGVYGGVNAYNQYLLPDEVQVWWIPTTGYYKTWFAGLSAGLEYRFKKGSGIGLTARHDLTPSFASLAQKTYFWRNATISYSLPLNHK